MKNRVFDNADSFAMAFDEEWQKTECEDIKLNIDKVINILSEHPFVVSSPQIVRKIAEFRIFSLKKYNN